MAVSIARGRRIFLFFATGMVVLKLLSLASAFSNGFGEVKWIKSVLTPIGLLAALYVCSTGDQFFRWLLGIAMTFTGLAMSYVCIRIMVVTAKITKPEQSEFFFQIIGIPVGFLLLFALFDLAMGLSLLLSPSVKAYLIMKREEQLVKQYIFLADDDSAQNDFAS